MKPRATQSAAIDRRRFLLGGAGLALLHARTARAASNDVFARVSGDLPAPDFALEDFGRKAWRMSALRGQIVVVNFWATWCPPCRREMPSLDSMHRAVSPKGALVLGINAGEPWETVAAYAAEFRPPLGFPLLTDEKGDVMRAWQVKALPSTYVVDRAGRIVLRALGGRDFSRPDAIEDVTRLALTG